MATLPSPTQVAGQHNAIYEAYYNVVDPKGIGSIGGMEAARFLKRSGLSDVILSKIWDLSDPGSRGSLDKAGMFVALKLVALVQSGQDLSLNNMHLDIPPPKMGDIPLPKPKKPPPPSSTPLITSLPPTAVDWSIKPTEREKYEKLFESLQPMNGLLAGNKVKNVLMESKLPFETLGKIWDLADQDKDGMLDRYEFIAAMHLVYKALDKFAIPNTLPVELMPPAKRKSSTSPAPLPLNRGMDGIKSDIPPSSLISQSLISSAPIAQVAPPVVQPGANWVVSKKELSDSDTVFRACDLDEDGFVSGKEIKTLFLESGLPQSMLAHIWSLCDINQSGKLNNEQFALAKWLVDKGIRGIQPPTTLTPEMVPPSFRKMKPDGLVENNNTKYSNPELEMISKDIEQLSRERLGLETEITQKEADIRIKKSEITSLQSELDTLAATLKQLENQKGEAQKRLNDLKAQTSENEILIAGIVDDIKDHETRVDKLRTQAAEQAATVAAQETELNSKKQQLEGLKQEEERLEKELSENTNTLDKLTASMQESQLNISQAKALQTQLEEQTRQLTDAINSCDSAITSGDASQVPDTSLRINPDFREARQTNLGLMNGTSSTDQNRFLWPKNNIGQNLNPFFMPNYSALQSMNTQKTWSLINFGGSHDDPFSNKNDTSGFDRDPFQNDPFNNNSNAFGSGDAFSAAFGSSINDGFNSDPFGTSRKASDPFEAFGDSRKNSEDGQLPQEADKDLFDCDPFAILHAPTRDGSAPRSASPSPALPPKKSKQPPPRPAPPRPQPPKKVTPSDPFGGDSFGSGGGSFADFSDFDSKLSNKTSSSSLGTTGQLAVGKQSKRMEFVDDPFRDYRYEDPFNISFEDDEPLDNSKKSKSVDAFNTPKNNDSNFKSSWDNEEINRNRKDFELDKFDPFGLDGRQSVPLPTTDLFENNINISNNNGRASVPIKLRALNEDQLLAWAAAESVKEEKDRQLRRMQEEADLKLAISLSKAESKKY